VSCCLVAFSGAGAGVAGDEGSTLFNVADPSAVTVPVNMTQVVYTPSPVTQTFATVLPPTDWGTFAVHWVSSGM
jgi:hypothetical protein